MAPTAGASNGDGGAGLVPTPASDGTAGAGLTARLALARSLAVRGTITGCLVVAAGSVTTPGVGCPGVVTGLGFGSGLVSPGTQGS